MNSKHKAILESYGRSFVVAAIAAYSSGAVELEAIVIAGLAAIVGPAIRAINPNDPAFGRIADSVTLELNKLAKADKKKTVKKVTKKKS